MSKYGISEGLDVVVHSLLYKCCRFLTLSEFLSNGTLKSCFIVTWCRWRMCQMVDRLTALL